MTNVPPEPPSATHRSVISVSLDHGIRIARRTVAKYRSQMHILPSTTGHKWCGNLVRILANSW